MKFLHFLFLFSYYSFIAMLEYAERFLHCGHVIICFRKERSDRGYDFTFSVSELNIIVGSCFSNKISNKQSITEK